MARTVHDWIVVVSTLVQVADMWMVPTFPAPEQPGPSSALLAPARALAGGVLLSSLLFAVSAAGAQAAERRSASTKTPAPAEAAGGNPRFYEVFGKRYRVRASSDGYSETGVASWYGRPFHGRPTSSGEMYDMNEMTAAHTTLPLPTWAEVTNLANGKRVVVKINDRGPFVDKRVIDLSYAAAKALDIVQTGTARVAVRALRGAPSETTARERSEPSTEAVADAKVAKPAAPPSAPVVARADLPRAATVQPPPSGQAERLFAQAGKFKERSDAVELVESLRALGFVNAFIVTEDGRRKSLHRVRVGPLPDDAEVERVSDRLRGLGARRSRSVVMQ